MVVLTGKAIVLYLHYFLPVDATNKFKKYKGFNAHNQSKW